MIRNALSKQDPRLAKLLKALAGIKDPLSGLALNEAGILSEIIFHEDKVSFSLVIAPDQAELYEPVRIKASKAAHIDGISQALVSLTSAKVASSMDNRQQATGQVSTHTGAEPASDSHTPKTIIAIASGKGGVGKSTTAVNLALAFQNLGFSTGLMDADVFGPSLPRLLDIHDKPVKAKGRAIQPLTKYGLELMSMGFLVDEGVPVVWRGPMVMSAIRQMLKDVAWSPLDVLVVDMPPGTGDAQLTLAQTVPLEGAVIVSTPQDLALIDARKGLSMFQQVKVPILGLIENMSYYTCPKCGHRDDIFAHGGAEAEAKKLGVPFLGGLPLSTQIRTSADAGTPIVSRGADHPVAATYLDMADNISRQLFDGLSTHRPPPEIIFE